LMTRKREGRRPKRKTCVPRAQAIYQKKKVVGKANYRGLKAGVCAETQAGGRGKKDRFTKLKKEESISLDPDGVAG